MSKKQRKPIVPGVGRHAAGKPDPAGILRDAVRLLRRGEHAVVQAQAERVLALKPAPGLAAAAHEVLAEAHFRAAMSTGDSEAQLADLDAALRHAPNAAKLHFHRGIALWREGRVAEASTALDAAAAREPGRRGLAYLRSLARIATGRKWDAAGLAPAEVNTLRAVDALVRPDPPPKSVGIEEPVLGNGVEFWQALAEMRVDRKAAPRDQLRAGIEKNSRKSVMRILLYFQGVAALRGGDRDRAISAWRSVQNAQWTNPVLGENLTTLLLENAPGLMEEGRWQELLRAIDRLPDSSASDSRLVAETASIACQHLGSEAAQAGKWSAAVKYWSQANDLTPNRYLAQNLALAEEALEKWKEAAEHWREMVRRRPRKKDHPDYLTDAQVAALWSHAAECYEKIDDVAEIETCLHNAMKYAPDDTGLRLRLADVLADDDQFDAAETLLEDIVAQQPQNIEALVRLARLFSGEWGSHAMQLWRQVLEVDPGHREARDALAEEYAWRVQQRIPFSAGRAVIAPRAGDIEWIENGLRELPGHPRLLLALGVVLSIGHHLAEARETLLQAYAAAPRDLAVLFGLLHELLHVGAGDAVEDLLPDIRQIHGVMPRFWFDEAALVLDYKLDQKWAELFIEEAVNLAGQSWVDDTRAGLLVEAHLLASGKAAQDLSDVLAKRIRDEWPNSGASTLIEACSMDLKKDDSKAAARLMKRAIREARDANDKGVLRRAEELDLLSSSFFRGLDLNRIFSDFYPDIPF